MTIALVLGGGARRAAINHILTKSALRNTLRSIFSRAMQPIIEIDFTSFWPF
jgi:hypothetical protein